MATAKATIMTCSMSLQTDQVHENVRSNTHAWNHTCWHEIEEAFDWAVLVILTIRVLKRVGVEGRDTRQYPVEAKVHAWWTCPFFVLGGFPCVFDSAVFPPNTILAERQPKTKILGERPLGQNLGHLYLMGNTSQTQHGRNHDQSHHTLLAAAIQRWLFMYMPIRKKKRKTNKKQERIET